MSQAARIRPEVGDYIFAPKMTGGYDTIHLIGVVTEVSKSRVYYLELPFIAIALIDGTEHEHYKLPLPKEVIGFSVVDGKGQSPFGIPAKYMSLNTIKASMPSYLDAYRLWRNSNSINRFELELNRYLMAMSNKLSESEPYFTLPDMPKPTLNLCDNVELHDLEYQREIRPYIELASIHFERTAKDFDGYTLKAKFDWPALQAGLNAPALYAHINTYQNVALINQSRKHKE